MKGVKLVATPLSHYGRKVRILLDLYKIPYEFSSVVGGNVALTKSPSEVAGNPLMKVPVLFHEDNWVIESDHIASYIVSRVDSSDQYAVETKVLFDLNTRAMLNGIMAEEVKVIVAQRHNVPTHLYSNFGRSIDAVKNGLSWLEQNHNKFNIKTPTYREFHLACCWDHLVYYDFIKEMEINYPKINEIVQNISGNPIIYSTSPNIVVPKPHK